MEFKEKNKTLIFCLCGKAGSGKSFASECLFERYKKDNLDVIISPYTKYLKYFIEEITGVSIVESNKPRVLLQHLSSDLIKSKLGYRDFFVRRQLEDISLYKYFFDIIIIPDVRFPEEIKVLKDHFTDVISIGVKRLNFDNGLTDEEKKDITETSLDSFEEYDYVIYNNGDDTFKSDILSIVEKIKERG